MTTSDPQADRRDDDSRQHRGLGQRLRDAVLGEPADTRQDTRSDVPAGTTDSDRGDVGRDREHVDPARSDTARDLGHADPEHGDAGRGDTDRDYGSYEQAMREHVAGGAVPDPVRDDIAQDTTSRDVRGADDRAPVGGAPETAGRGRGDDRDLVTGAYDPHRDTGYDPQAAGTAMGGVADTREERDRDDLVTSSYDPDRDTGYDPQAAGTAMSGTAGSTTAEQGRDYDPAHDTGYVDQGRADADRTTGHRDADYDTGRVDADRDTARSTGVGTAGAVAAGGAAAAGLAAAAHHHRDRDRDTDRDTGGTRFSEVDDTATVDDSGTGRGTPDRGATTGTSGDDATDRRAQALADEGSENRRERLVPSDRARDYSSRWDALKGDFVDEPRRAVRQADELVGELLDEMQQLFARQRHDLEQGLDHDRASTEDLRLALRRYRSFFDRLLSF